MDSGGPQLRLIDGRFALQQRLGGGGMGLVWLAHDTALQRDVALKEVRPPDPTLAESDPTAAAELRERVLREARALARLQHPNVVTIHHIVDSPEHPHPWLVMELVTGGSLHDRLGRGPLSVPEAARIGRGVLAALTAAHQAGIQHRDVKPGNVLLRPDGTPVLTDFGIAAMQGTATLTETGALIGSPEYIAPERIRGEEGNPSSDLWSLGMMLYVAVEGHHPLRRGTALATLAAVLDEPLPPAQHAGPLGPLLAQLLGKDPARRPDAAQLDQLLSTAENPLAAPGFGPPLAYTPTAQLTPPQAQPQPQPQPGYGYPATDAVPYPTGPAPYPSGPTGYPSGGQAPYPSGPVPFPNDQVPHPSGSTPFPAPYGTGPVPAVPRTRRRAALAAAIAAVLAVAGTVTWFEQQNATAKHGAGAPPVSAPANATPGATTPGATPSGTAPSTDTPAAQAPATGDQDPFSPATVRATLQAMHLSTSKVLSLKIYQDGHAIAEVPTDADPKLFDEVDYQGGKLTREPDTGVIPENLVDLSSYSWDTLPNLSQQAQATLNVPHPKLRYLIVEYDVFFEGPSMNLYLTDDYGGAYLAADSKGAVKRTVKHD
ncbi:protein kinase [Kitasatospora sp. NPDC058965]|uniref:serine/threonine-protein kinase n=1 Tax=Kitasatospora sp. NPDC058965 TaxID=3346682 RepID=UPI00368118C3